MRPIGSMKGGSFGRCANRPKDFFREIWPTSTPPKSRLADKNERFAKRALDHVGSVDANGFRVCGRCVTLHVVTRVMACAEPKPHAKSFAAPPVDSTPTGSSRRVWYGPLCGARGALAFSRVLPPALCKPSGVGTTVARRSASKKGTSPFGGTNWVGLQSSASWDATHEHVQIAVQANTKYRVTVSGISGAAGTCGVSAAAFRVSPN
jgi:hypothetical protein